MKKYLMLVLFVLLTALGSQAWQFITQEKVRTAKEQLRFDPGTTAQPVETPSTFPLPGSRMTATGSNSLITNSNSGSVPAPWAGVTLKGVKTAAPGTQMPDVYGYVRSSKNGLAKGLYRLPRNANDSFSLLCDGFKSDFEGCLAGDIYYSTRQVKLPIPPPFAQQSIIFYEGHDIYSGDLLTNARQIGEAENNKAIPCAMSYNPVDGKIYALLGGHVTASRLVTIEIPSKLDDVKITTIAEYSPAGKLISLAIDNEGKGYVIDNHGYLNSIDLSNGQIKQIGFTEIMPATVNSGMTFDRKTGRLFWSVKDELKSALYEVNPTTAETTLIAVYPGNEFVTGIFTLDPINDKVPGPGTAVTTGGFEKGSKTGSFSFTAPTTLADGTVASGNVKYRVYVNDKEMFSGTTSYGQQTTISPVTVGDRGKVCFSVVFSNDVGDSRKAQCHTDIGNSIPLAVFPQTISTRKTNDGVRIKWRGIRFGTDDCYFDPTQVKYDVYRYCAGDGIRTLVASEISDTTITDVFSAPENATIYQYQIYSKFATETSEVTYSSHIVLGHKELPFACDFSTPYTLLDWNIVNMNNDLVSTHYTWSWDKIGNIPSASLYGVKGYPEDDWLITPLFKMKAGKAYRVRMRAGAVIKANNGTVAMYYGNSINPESMDTIDGELLPPTKVKDITVPYGDEGNILRFESYIVPERDCDIAIGIHGEGVGSVDILSFDISEGVDARRPGVVTDLTATGEVKQLKAQIKFNAPKYSLMNIPLEKLTKIEILRDDTIAIGTIDNPAPGAPVTVNIDKAVPGVHRYRIVPYNEYGEGAASVVTVKVGFDAPNPPAEAKQVETTTLGTTTLTWNPVTMTASKQNLTGEDVAYNVATIEGNAVGKILHKNLRDTTARVFWQAPNAEQSFAQFCVQAVTNGGGSAWQASEIIPVGKPYTDYYHCFAGGGLDGFGIGFMNIVDWRTLVSIRSDILEPYIKSATGDGGYLGIMMKSVDAVTEVFSGKISLKDAAHPGMVFYVYNVAEDDKNLYSVLVRESGQEEWTEVIPDTEVCSLGGEGWNMTYVPLGQFKGKDIQYMIRVTGKSYKFTGLDDIKVGDIAVNDIATQNLVLPRTAYMGESVSVSATVLNNGSSDATGVTVELLCNGKTVGSFTADTIRAFKKYSHTFKVKIPAEDRRTAEFQLRVARPDENETNNLSEVKTVMIESSELPGVGTLTGEAQETSNRLAWNAPVREDMEWDYGFEEGTPGMQEYRNWTFIDADGYSVGAYDNIPIIGVTAGETKASFIIFDGSQLDRNWTAHTGDLCLINLYRMDRGRVDDWAISPELSGEGQTITFWSRNLIDQDGNRGVFSVCYSTTGKETTDFVEADGFKEISAGTVWTKYEVTLPAGAKYFAIHSNGKGPWIQFFDDFNMWIKGPDNFTLSGYNVYRDGERLNQELFNSNSYMDNEPLPGVHTYAVIPVYVQGAGRPSFISLETNGVETLTKGVVVSAEGHSIVIAGAEGLALSITSADGKVIYLAKGTDRTVVPVAPGIYMVRVAGKTVKILVK